MTKKQLGRLTLWASWPPAAGAVMAYNEKRHYAAGAFAFYAVLLWACSKQLGA